ncbi:MAG: DegQ family serine endoprotease [Neisseria sp.]|nr:DegQ family serine endoprotease [Neisseria sp.]
MNTAPKYLALAVSALLLAACGNKEESKTAEPNNDFVQNVETKTENGTINMLLPDFTKLVEQEGATVVSIHADRGNNDNQNDADSSIDPFEQFFRGLIPNQPNDEHEENNNSFGTGFIISPDGYILTNNHVVNRMEHIKVVLNDKREYTAKLIGSDSQSDVALLKIEASDLQVVKIGNAKSLKPGEWVVAIGAPFGFDSSVTAGIVSAKGRSLPYENYTPFIQTDVAVNPGNSGGPLFNLSGQVIGINSQIYSKSGGFMGISFAIPIDVAMNVAEQLKTTGKVQRGQLGVIIQEISYDLAKSFGLNKPSGALIAKVLPNSAAARAGLQVGDIVRSVNGEEVRASTELPVMIGSISPGKEVVLGIWRKGEPLDVNIQLGSTNDKHSDNDDNSSNASEQNAPQNGFTIENTGLTLSEQQNGGKKVLVVAQAEGLAARVGLRRGDVVLSVGREQVDDEAGFRQLWEQYDAHIPLLINRNGNALFLALPKP